MLVAPKKQKRIPLLVAHAIEHIHIKVMNMEIGLHEMSNVLIVQACVKIAMRIFVMLQAEFPKIIKLSPEVVDIVFYVFWDF